MGKNWIRAVALGLCVWLSALCLCPGTVARAMVLGTRPSQEGGGQGGVYRVTLDAQTVGEGETLSYETVAGSLAGNPYAGDYYPGELTVDLAGPIVIEKGGSLTIGTLSVGNPKERGPVIRGELCPQGLILVKAGGRLVLKTAALELAGEGLLLVQEPGGSVELADTAVADGLVQWAPPMVDNTYQRPLKLWLEEGTALTEELLPRTMKVPVQDRGEVGQRELALAWDLADYDGRTRGEWSVSGGFLDQTGEPLASVRPLELSVHWVAPETLVVTNTVWMGGSAATAKLELKELPDEAAEVWGEVSRDRGKSWTRWEGFELRRGEGVTAGVFSLPDAYPRQFRLRAANGDGSLRWTSDAFLLPKGGTSDQGGNRGGGTAVTRPSRVPASPSPEPTAPVGPTAAPTPTSTPTPVPTVEPTPIPSVGHGILDVPPTAEPSVEPTPTPSAPPTAIPEPTQAVLAPVEPTSTPVASSSAKPTPTATAEPTSTAGPSAKPTSTPAPSAEPIPTTQPTLPPTPSPAPGERRLPAAVQALLVIGGLGVCVSLGILFTRKRK